MLARYSATHAKWPTNADCILVGIFFLILIIATSWVYETI